MSWSVGSSLTLVMQTLCIIVWFCLYSVCVATVILVLLRLRGSTCCNYSQFSPSLCDANVVHRMVHLVLICVPWQSCQLVLLEPTLYCNCISSNVAAVCYHQLQVVSICVCDLNCVPVASHLYCTMPTAPPVALLTWKQSMILVNSGASLFILSIALVAIV